ncbi:MAG: insulinase family protein, partial [Ruminiclostridium sp.]|nr:insulinase family protein [Ruminiclostridium sp.]
FVDLIKSSMNTFLNAMTFGDKTMYPVSSRNKQDYLNLMSVYLDAVFAPALLRNPNIFYQEGRHTEIGENGATSYKGVVFNEMKGAMSNVDEKIMEDLYAQIFPDNCYRFNSGGDPKVIPDLTYEQFVATYKKFYHPSNARFWLDGSVPVEETLELIDSYLSKYEKSTDLPVLNPQKPVESESTNYYEIDSNQSPDKRALLSLGKIVCSWEDREKIAAAQVLCDYLADTNESPLKRAILSSGLAEDVDMGIHNHIAQSMMLLIIRNMNDADSGKIRELIRNTAADLISKGLDKAALTASLNRLEFKAKEGSEPQGLERAISSLNGWLHGGDPMLYLTHDAVFAKVRKLVENGGFEALLKELLLDDTGLCVLHTLPSKTLGQEEREAENARLAREQAARTPADIEALKKLNADLLHWQQSEDKPEDVAKLPTLPLSEVGPDPLWVETKEKDVEGVKVLFHPVPSQGIVHLALYFPLTGYSLEELTRLSLLPSLLGELPTEKHTAGELQQLVKTYIGTLSFRLEVQVQKGNTETCTPCLIAYASVLEENLVPAQELLCEILTSTKLDEADKIREIVAQKEEYNRQFAVNAGHILGRLATQARYSAAGAVREATGRDYTALKYIHDLAQSFDAQVPALIALLQSAQEKALGKTNLIVSVTATTEQDVTALLKALPAGENHPASAHYEASLPVRMGIRIPAQISFAEKGAHLSRLGTAHAGSLDVCTNILTYSYLWNAVRVQGGAYGVGAIGARNGDLTFHSYRDPSPARSLGVYDDSAKFLREFCAGDENLTKFIISTIGSSEPLDEPAVQGTRADTLWFAGITKAAQKALRQQILATTRQDLLDWCPVLEQAAKEGAVCVVGHEEALKACGELEIVSL